MTDLGTVPEPEEPEEGAELVAPAPAADALAPLT
jgi:hypothetical protein